jgi:hypothetical protein
MCLYVDTVFQLRFEFDSVVPVNFGVAAGLFAALEFFFMSREQCLSACWRGFRASIQRRCIPVIRSPGLMILGKYDHLIVLFSLTICPVYYPLKPAGYAVAIGLQNAVENERTGREALDPA